MVVQWLEKNIVLLKLWVNLMKMQQLASFKCGSLRVSNVENVYEQFGNVLNVENLYEQFGNVLNVENVYEQFGNVSNVDVLQLAHVKTQVTTQRPHIQMSIGLGFCVIIDGYLWI